jgi:Domain of unknown function (DUF4375)
MIDALVLGGIAVAGKDIDLFKVSGEVSARSWTLGYQALHSPERVFLCVWELEAEVNNGGFDQYYFNEPGGRAIEAVRALVAIGAARMAAIVREANCLYGQAGPAPDRKTRQVQLLALPSAATERMSQLDAEFCNYPDNLEALLKAYVHEHAGVFSGS